jgi:hypothetical protein
MEFNIFQAGCFGFMAGCVTMFLALGIIFFLINRDRKKDQPENNTLIS